MDQVIIVLVITRAITSNTATVTAAVTVMAACPTKDISY